MALTVEQRLKELEDMLGITEKRERKEEFLLLVSAYVAKGMSKKQSKNMAWRIINGR